MAKNLKKFVNPKFLRTCDLRLMRELMTRHQAGLSGIDLTAVDGDEDIARAALEDFFVGPETNYPAGLTTDLHRIGALGTRRGMFLLLQRAKRAGVDVSALAADDSKSEPKNVALHFFLRHPGVFDAASDLLALERTTLTELRGGAGGVVAALDDAAKQAFRDAAAELLRRHLQGGYCRAGWYHDGDEVNLVVVHGMEITNEWIVGREGEQVISFRPLGTAVLSYDPVEGRLKIGGLSFSMAMSFACLVSVRDLGARPSVVPAGATLVVTPGRLAALPARGARYPLAAALPGRFRAPAAPPAGLVLVMEVLLVRGGR